MKQPVTFIFAFLVSIGGANAQVPNANQVWAGPQTGNPGFPAWRALVQQDIFGLGRNFLVASKTFYVNNSTGNDSNDCLSATVTGGDGPCATINHGVSVAKNLYDIGGQSLPVVSVATGTGTYTEQISVSGATIGGGAIQVTGSGSGNITVQAPSGLYAVSSQSWAGIQFTGFTFGCASGAAGGWLAAKNAQIDATSDIKFSTCAGAAQVTAISGSQINFVGAPTFSGNAGAAINLDSGSRLSASGGFSISGNPTYSTTMLQNTNSYILFAGGTVSGSFTGTKFLFAGNAYAEANATSLNSVISGGTNGILTLGAMDDAGDNPTSVVPAGGVSCPSGITAGTVTVVNGVVTHC